MTPSSLATVRELSSTRLLRLKMQGKRFLYSSALVVGTTLPATALELALPDAAVLTLDQRETGISFDLPVAPYAMGSLQVETINGATSAASWSFPIGPTGTAGVMEALRSQLTQLGFAPLLDCAHSRCGGFDFRFQLATLPEPAMHIDLGDYRYLSAIRENPDAPPTYLQLIVSRSATKAYVQVTEISEHVPDTITTVSSSTSPQSIIGENGLLSVSEHLLEHGYATLDDLTFGTGSSQLEGDVFTSVSEIATFLTDNPDFTLALVGHTDAQGSLAANMSLSKRRAQSVVDLLASDFGISRARLEAEGVGYLSPRASNQSDEGRQINRRVEAVITSTR